MRDLTNPRTLKLKAFLFLVLGILCATLLILGRPPNWSFCRCYYFAFYVLEHHVDPTDRYSGLLSAARQILRK
jgi:hypothetical protein